MGNVALRQANRRRQELWIITAFIHREKNQLATRIATANRSDVATDLHREQALLDQLQSKVNNEELSLPHKSTCD
jgi:hypothetical protein